MLCRQYPRRRQRGPLKGYGESRRRRRRRRGGHGKGHGGAQSGGRGKGKGKGGGSEAEGAAHPRPARSGPFSRLAGIQHQPLTLRALRVRTLLRPRSGARYACVFSRFACFSLLASRARARARACACFVVCLSVVLAPFYKTFEWLAAARLEPYPLPLASTFSSFFPILLVFVSTVSSGGASDKNKLSVKGIWHFHQGVSLLPLDTRSAPPLRSR